MQNEKRGRSNAEAKEVKDEERARGGEEYTGEVNEETGRPRGEMTPRLDT